MSIDSLTSEVARLSSSVEFWRLARITVLALTALLATATLISTWMESRASRSLAHAQRELLRLKDEQLRIELTEKDLRIADANRAAGDANAEAARALKAAGEANERAGAANERAAGFERDAEDLRRRNFEMQRQLQVTTRTATATHRQLLPRSLTDDQIAKLSRALSKANAKARIPIIASESTDARNLALQLTNVFLAAGWDTEPKPGTASPAWEGVILTVDDLRNTPESATLIAAELIQSGIFVTLTDRAGGPKVHTLESGTSLDPRRPKLQVLNLWIGEKPAIREEP